MSQMSIFDGSERLKITNPIRIIELFAGYGSQSLALKYLGVPFEHWKICEWAVKSIQAYKDMHFGNDKTDYSNGLSDAEITDILFASGISSNYNTPMSREQIARLPNKKQILNNIIATNNLVSVCNVHGEDLNIVDTNKYTYILTYSFPCQDLSKAGKMEGMSRGSGTRSGLLWEVERILRELRDKNQPLPQVLLMENVADVIGTNNIAHFAEWVRFLDGLGYTSKWEILNAKGFDIPQNRDRCFMVSWLGDYYYDFPQPTRLKKRIKNVLETDVPEKYFLSKEDIERISKWKAQQKPLEHIMDDNSVCPCITARGAGEDHSGMILYGYPEPVALDEQNQYVRRDGCVGALTTDGSSPKHNNRIILPNRRIRKITPRECFRLMGVKDEDYDKVAPHQSDSSLYHLAGDSIVTNVLMAIFKQML